MLVIEGPLVRTEEPANTDGRRRLDLIETEFNMPRRHVLEVSGVTGTNAGFVKEQSRLRLRRHRTCRVLRKGSCFFGFTTGFGGVLLKRQ